MISLPLHGSPADRGSADAYYCRIAKPHQKLEGGAEELFSGPEDPRWQEYMDAYNNEDDRKDWG
jgi:hypothetical protein